MGVYRLASIVSEGLVFNMDFGDRLCYPRAGTSCYDMAKSQQVGEFVSSPTFNSTKGGFLTFNGTNYIKIPNSTALDTQTPSVEVWVRVSDTGAASFFFEKGTVNTQYALFLEGGNITWRLNGITPGDLDTLSSTYLNTTDWFQIVGTFTTGSRILYVNGVSVNSDAGTGTVSTSNGGMSLAVYGGYAGSRGYNFNGDIGVCRVYNRVLTAVEVKRNFDFVKRRFRP